jgi:hypothetical protein
MCYWELFMEHVWNLGTLCFDHGTLYSPHQTQLEKKDTPFFLTHKKRKGGPFIACRDFSLIE